MTDYLDPSAQLDVRKTKCPLNFVKARLALEKLPVGAVLEVWIDADSDSVMNIPQSMAASGHTVVRQTTLDEGTLSLWVQRGPT